MTARSDALLKEVHKLLKANFTYPVEDLEWVLPVVVVPKKMVSGAFVLISSP